MLSDVGGIVCTPPPPFLLGGFESPTNFSKSGRLDRISIFRGGLLGTRGDFFQGVCSFYIKNKLKSQILIDKKSLSAKMFFSVITKN